MLKKYLLFCLFVPFSFNVYASIWDDIVTCLSDPCNCGQSDRTEIWNKGSKHEVKRGPFKPGTLCPPWNKSDGRNNDTCLLQFDYPGTFIGFLLNRCAEEAPDSSYFTPKIRIRVQSCNAIACWHQNSTLNWDGECVLWPTGYGLPLTRVCARVAIPDMDSPSVINASHSYADPGYTEGVHLNKVGYTESDNKIIGVDGQIITLKSPKLCAYSDPGLVNLISDSGIHLDPMDWNPNRQPLHQTNELSPIAKVLKFLVETVKGFSLPSLLGQLLGMIDPNSEFIKVLQSILNAIGEVFNFFPDLIIKVIEKLGALNSAVDSYSFGCVQLPLGPFPPPYCQNLNAISINPNVNNVCSKKNASGTFDQSSTSPSCVVPSNINVRNNIVNNTIRVSFSNLVPLCTGVNPDLKTCIELRNIDFSSAKITHTNTAFKDLIKSCKNTSGNAACINTEIPTPCSVTANGCNEGFRIVYSQKIGNIETPHDYYRDDIPDCPSANATTCQKVWGVNIGEFQDVSIKFPKVQKQDTNSLIPIKTDITLKDNNGKDRKLYVSISNTEDDKQNPNNICLFESGNLIDCVPRVNHSYSLAAYECAKQYAGITCTNNSNPNDAYYKPQFIASLQVREGSNIIDETSTLVTPLSYAGPPPPNPTDTESIVMLAGYQYSSSVAFIPKNPTEDKYIAMPFSGANALNQLTIHGKYKDDKEPYDSNGNPDLSAVYLKYLEYINGKYIQGGTHACLMPKNFQHCNPMPHPTLSDGAPIPGYNNESENCVLAKVNNNDTINCKDFKNKYNAKYPNLGLCKKDIDLTRCSIEETVSGPKKGITIYTCNINKIPSKCYTNNDNANTPICVLSRDYTDRIKPEPSIGPILVPVDPSKYYTVTYTKGNENTPPEPTYNAETEDVRDKTWQELNLCAPILVPTCTKIPSTAEAPSGKSHGNAEWPKSDIGELVKGKCPTNWILIDPNKPLERHCLSYFDRKVVEFEPLGHNVGCRKSTGLPIQVVYNDFPSNQLPDTPYNPVTKIGDYFLNKKPVRYGSIMAFPKDGAFISAGHEPDNTILHTVIFKVTLDAIMDDIEYFIVEDLWYDDCTLIYVNGTKLLSLPTDVDSLDEKRYCNNGKDQGKALQAKVNNKLISAKNPIDIKPYLKQGENFIKFQLRVMFGGGLYFHMQYKMKR
ncbi:hypothetical protein [Rickettsia typhi]|uniref:Uncharacterized protein n=2 Tax=Rickettsia typhi TaxID=785 RepID=Q68VW3_RICTY|nr:hypothetical protein [Rickettsia typhi]AAU04229.1 rickettsial conserved hypothetical protein [Rickettsia typhi str. Wilmington]AFE54608.1 hypothetical protein RTTH1527_03715 [Rickettsia typhi str. TH1527]AFE55446.1 hypothetical protein RTB9991CWPP_03715 [Rickettsia typhi str. B9991CWPP]